MLTAELDYELPPDRIAQVPAEPRDASRLLHVRRDGGLEDRGFRDLPSLLGPEDLLVVNDTRVRRARLKGDLDGAPLELLVIEARGDGTHLCLARPARRARPGAEVRFEGGLQAVVVGPDGSHPGARRVRFAAPDSDADTAIERAGIAPLPPYIRDDGADPDRYQTVYATGAPESAAAPTAGLHFTPRVMEALRRRGVGWTAVRLEVGLATFVPITAATVEAHAMHAERCTVPADAAAAIAAARRNGGRIVAVGTTVVRTLESHVTTGGNVEEGQRSTRLFITPGHRFRAVDGLLTNFHQPRSSLLALLAAFIGDEAWRGAYDHALATGYRFLSFGDCMLCWRREQ